MRRDPHAETLERLRSLAQAPGPTPEGPEAQPPRRRRAVPSRRWAITPKVGIAMALAAMLAGLAVIGVLMWHGAGPAAEAPAVDLPLPGAAASERDQESPAAQEPAELLVHVAGQVNDPGLLRLEPGDRVGDAVIAAGGPTEQADLDAVNLAAEVADGEQVYVPAVGQNAPGGAQQAGSGGDAGTVNINSADAASLESLPGVGPALAQRIIDYREEHGPFGSVADLEGVSGIGPSIMSQVSDLATT